MLLVFEYFFPQLVSLVHQGLMLSLHSLIVSLTALPSQKLFDLVCKMLVKILGYFEFLLYDFELVLQGLVQALIFLILGSKATRAFTP